MDEIFSSEPAAKIVERLFSSSLIAIVANNEQNKLKVCIRVASIIFNFQLLIHLVFTIIRCVTSKSDLIFASSNILNTYLTWR